MRIPTLAVTNPAIKMRGFSPVNEYSTISIAGGNAVSVNYDADGNLTKDHRGYSYVYDYENRLICIYLDDDSSSDYNASYDRTVAEFTYDALGRRIQMVAYDNSGTSVTSTTTRFYYDDQRVLLETDATGTEHDVRYFVYGNYIDEVLMMADVDSTNSVADGYYYYAQDHLYSDVALFDADGAVVERYEYDAYGKARIMDPSYVDRAVSLFQNPYLFTGRRMDIMDNGELKLMYYRARNYDPETGRFMQRDPVGPVDGMNIYQYVQSNPIMREDAMGLCGESWLNPYGDPRGYVGTDPIENRKDPRAGCCRGRKYDLVSQCCENGKVVAKEPIWICTRPLGGYGANQKVPKIPPAMHMFVSCKDPKTYDPVRYGPQIAPDGHRYLPNPTFPAYGKQPWKYKRDKNGCIIITPSGDTESTDSNWTIGPGYIEPEPFDTSLADCKKKRVCPKEKASYCNINAPQKTKDPYWFPGFLCPGLGSNCQDWGRGLTH